MTYKDLKILNELLERTENLPDILHLRAAEAGYIRTEEDKKLLLDTYLELDNILKEVAAFINIKFPGAERHIKAWNDIDFDTKIGGFKIVTTDREHIKREWRNGLFDLKSLIIVLKSEVSLLISDEKSDSDSRTNVRNFHGNIIYNENSNEGNQTINQNRRKETKETSQRPWLEIASWVAGIIGTMLALYYFLK